MNALNNLRLISIVLLLFASLFTAQAQSNKKSILSQDGFWVIETEPKSGVSTVRFYTNDQQLVYQETVSRKLNIHRLKVKKQLNVALEQAMFVWQATHQIPTDRQWVAVQLAR